VSQQNHLHFMSSCAFLQYCGGNPSSLPPSLQKGRGKKIIERRGLSNSPSVREGKKGEGTKSPSELPLV
jgi:hypothetical protein